ncbi:GTP cyclohydrolase II [Campylobacter sp. FMV-PI01]|uniref:GTP cyclohydrolase-2 n=1 Tax=Campylobacter portucalensis TaxID=2608384 RepID=A0A6L5WJD4_9BACT|nr:GTP cyclohydrolase II [Campylobacter portucalensis]MSN96367.1 GTP cyclohydrolase II [Campylobacter portucalensis]
MDIEISEFANLPTVFGKFKIIAFKENFKEHLVIMNDLIDNKNEAVNVRIHSECITGDTLGSLKCDCGEQLRASLDYIEKNGGLILYLRQEGRNIGLLNKINAYALQDKGFDTIEANHQLGFKADERTYEIVDFILNHFGIKEINLLTNNPEKLQGLKSVKIVKRIPIIIKANKFNKNYLEIKKNQMGHLLDE